MDCRSGLELNHEQLCAELFSGSRLAGSRLAAVVAIQKVHRREASVALYPYAAIQHPTAELDG